MIWRFGSGDHKQGDARNIALHCLCLWGEHCWTIIEWELKNISNYSGVHLRARSPTPHLQTGKGLRLASQAAGGGLGSGPWWPRLRPRVTLVQARVSKAEPIDRQTVNTWPNPVNLRPAWWISWCLSEILLRFEADRASESGKRTTCESKLCTNYWIFNKVQWNSA